MSFKNSLFVSAVGTLNIPGDSHVQGRVVLGAAVSLQVVKVVSQLQGVGEGLHLE